MKKTIGIIMTIVFMFSFALSTTAQSNIAIQPFWDNTDSITYSISYSSNSANCSVIIVGKVGTTQITNCNVYLKDSNGSTIASWTGNSASGDTLRFQKTATGVSAGNTYTLSFSATVYRNGNTENISGSYSKKY